MACFDRAISVILEHEGGSAYTNKPADKGGPTKYGITARTLGAWRELGRPATPAEVQSLGEEEARTIYRIRYWEACRCGEMADQQVATKVFDIAVNCGPGTVGRLLQSAVNRCQPEHLDEDGVIGPRTLAAVEACASRKLLHELVHVQGEHYRAIVERDPSQAPHLPGWLARSTWPLGRGA